MPTKIAQPSPEADNILQQLQTMPPVDHYHLLRSHIQGRVARVLAVNETNLVVDRSLLELGIDSLMALELRNRIAADLKVDLPIVKFIEGPTIAQIAELLLEQLGNGPTEDLKLTTTPTHQPQINENEITDGWEEGEL